MGIVVAEANGIGRDGFGNLRGLAAEGIENRLTCVWWVSLAGIAEIGIQSLIIQHNYSFEIMGQGGSGIDFCAFHFSWKEAHSCPDTNLLTPPRESHYSPPIPTRLRLQNGIRNIAKSIAD